MRSITSRAMIKGHGRRAMVGSDGEGSSTRPARGGGAGAIDGDGLVPSAGALTGVIVRGAGALTGVIVRGAAGALIGVIVRGAAGAAGGVTRGGGAVTWTAYADCAGEGLPVCVCGKLSSSEIF